MLSLDMDTDETDTYVDVQTSAACFALQSVPSLPVPRCLRYLVTSVSPSLVALYTSEHDDADNSTNEWYGGK